MFLRRAPLSRDRQTVLRAKLGQKTHELLFGTDFIPLQKEQEILSLYLKLEHYRFRDKFDYEIKVDENVNPEAIQIPPMLIQPYIENAVWHGLTI